MRVKWYNLMKVSIMNEKRRRGHRSLMIILVPTRTDEKHSGRGCGKRNEGMCVWKTFQEVTEE